MCAFLPGVGESVSGDQHAAAAASFPSSDLRPAAAGPGRPRLGSDGRRSAGWRFCLRYREETDGHRARVRWRESLGVAVLPQQVKVLRVERAHRLPFPSAAFDGAYLVTVLGEIPDPAAAVHELRRVLKPA